MIWGKEKKAENLEYVDIRCEAGMKLIERCYGKVFFAGNVMSQLGSHGGFPARMMTSKQ